MAQDVEKENLAEGLFRAARREMRAGEYASACPKLEESYHLDPASGTLLNLAVCEERLGKEASAWVQYVRFIETAPGDDRVPWANKRIKALEPHLPRLRIASTQLPANASLSLDGVPLSPASMGVDMPVDAGEHRVELLLGNGQRVERTAKVEPDQVVTIALTLPLAEEVKHEPNLDAVATSADAQRTPAKALVKSPTPSSRPRQHAHNRALTSAGYTAGVIGVLGFAGATVLSILASSKKSTVTEHCENKQCDDTGLRAASDGRALLRAADVGLVVGTLGIGSGAVLLWEAWHATPAVATQAGGALLTIKGSW